MKETPINIRTAVKSLTTRQAHLARQKANAIILSRYHTRQVIVGGEEDDYREQPLTADEADQILTRSGLKKGEFSKRVLPYVWRSLAK